MRKQAIQKKETEVSNGIINFVLHMYKQLSREQRYGIYLGLQDGKTFTAIAQQIGCSISTVSREVKRNTNRHGHYIFMEAVELASIMDLVVGKGQIFRYFCGAIGRISGHQSYLVKWHNHFV